MQNHFMEILFEDGKSFFILYYFLFLTKDFLKVVKMFPDLNWVFAIMRYWFKCLNCHLKY